MSKGGDDTQQTTQTASTVFPQWTQDAAKNLYGVGAAMAAPGLQIPKYQTAGFNTDQLQAYELARGQAQNAFTQGATAVPNTQMTAAQTRAPMMVQTAQLGDPRMATAAQVNPNDIAAGMNPYLGAVIDPAVQQATRALRESQTQIGARSAAAGSFGGSREALQRGQADRAYNENVTATVAQLMSQGWDQATALAQANAAMRQQTELTNAATENNFDLTQAGYQQQANAANAGAVNQVDQFNAGLTQQAGLANQGYGLDRAQIEEATRASDYTRQQSALQQLMGIGDRQQIFAQGVLDTPWTNLSRLAGVTPQVFNQDKSSVETSPDNSPSEFQQIAGAGLAIGGMKVNAGGSLLGNYLGSLSDPKTKTNIQKLGKDPDTGLMTYAYDYKADVDAAKKSGGPMGPKRVGPMADEIERAMPGTTKRIGGNLAVMFG